MSKSKDFGPGAYELENGTCFQSTSLLEKPSCFATAYATALSKPCPLRGSLTFHGFFGVPPNHGGKAGLSVPTVSFPAETRFRSLFAQLELEPPPEVFFFVEPQAAASAATSSAKSATRSALMLQPL